MPALRLQAVSSKSVKYKYLASYGLATRANILRWYRDTIRKADERGELIDKLALGRQVREMIKKCEEEGHGRGET